MAKMETGALDSLISSVPAKADEVTKNVAYIVEAIAKVRAPVDTSALRNSINTEKKGVMLYHVQDAVEYGIFQEYGTSKMSAQPFMIPAAEHAAGQALKMYGVIFNVSKFG